mgnify:FL=1
MKVCLCFGNADCLPSWYYKYVTPVSFTAGQWMRNPLLFKSRGSNQWVGCYMRRSRANNMEILDLQCILCSLSDKKVTPHLKWLIYTGKIHSSEYLLYWPHQGHGRFLKAFVFNLGTGYTTMHALISTAYCLHIPITHCLRINTSCSIY